MNEQLLKIAQQAGLTLSVDQQVAFQRAAELIVQECADFIAPLGDWCGGHGEPRMPSTSECAKKLKEHFGVEE
jgi:hypothetical protein